MSVHLKNGYIQKHFRVNLAADLYVKHGVRIDDKIVDHLITATSEFNKASNISLNARREFERKFSLDVARATPAMKKSAEYRVMVQCERSKDELSRKIQEIGDKGYFLRKI